MTRQQTLVRGGRVIDPSQSLDETTDLLIEDGQVARTGKNLKAEGAEIIEAKGKIVSPGFIDLHVHLRTPGQEHKETILSGSQAAARGGYTTVCAMANTDPPVDSPNLVEFIRSESAKVGLVNILPYGAITMGLLGETLTEMSQLASAGAVGFSDDGMPVASAGMMRRALEYSRVTGLPVIDHCEEKSLSAHGVVHEGLTAVRLGLAGIPAESETVMIARDLLLAEATGGRLHIAHVSTAAGVELLRAAKKKKVQVTAEVTPHHLTLTEEALQTYDARFKMNPPLRSQKDLEALREGLSDGTLDAVATDHAPHAQAEKEAGLAQAPFGVMGLETALPVLLTELVHRGLMKLPALIAALTCRPAKVLGIDRGTLRPGSPADLVLFDPDAEWVVDPAGFSSKGRNSPFLGWRLKGRVTDLWVGGRQILKSASLLTFLIGAILSSVYAAEELPPEAQQLTEKRAAVTSYRTRFTLEAKEEDGQLFQMEGTLLFRIPGQRRLEIHPPGSQEEPQWVISDGKVEWQSYPEGGVVYRVVNPPEAPGPHRPFSEALPGTIRFIGIQETAQGKILRFEAKPLPKSVDGAPVPIEKIRIDVAEKDGLARELALLDEKGNAVMTQRFSDVELNVPVSDQEFSYTPKQGTAVVDVPALSGEGS